jgi:hypothetical protein
MNPSRLSVADVQAIVERGEPVTFIDSRNPIAWASSKIKIRALIECQSTRSTNIPPSFHGTGV